MHRQCYQVEVPGDTTTICTVYDYGYGTVRCTQNTERRYRTQCDEKPVSINPDLERRNIDSWSSSLRYVESNLNTAWNNCYRNIVDLPPEEAYKYY